MKQNQLTLGLAGRARTIIRKLGAAVTLTTVALALAAPGAASTATGVVQPAGDTQVSDAGQVTIRVTWSGPSVGPIFSVVMDTHVVDLDQYDLLALALLRTDQGVEVQPSAWDAPPGGHHREGTLAFPETTADGYPLIGPETYAIELVIRDVAGIAERVFQWAW